MTDHDLRTRAGFQYLLDSMTPASPYGKALVRRPPFFGPEDRPALEQAWHNVGVAMEGLRTQAAGYEALHHLLSQMRDIRGTLRRMADTVLHEVELFELKRFLLQLARLVPMFSALGAPYAGIAFTEETAALDLLDPEGRRLAAYAVHDAYSKPLAQARAAKRSVEQALRAANDEASRAALLAERQGWVAREEAETLAVREGLTEALRPFAAALLRNAEMIGMLDFTVQKAVLARRYGMTRPRICAEGVCLQGMFNPRHADALAERGLSFTPLTLEAPAGATVLTGANMGGKSVALETALLNVLLCQSGFFTCAEAAAVPLFDAVHLIAEDAADAGTGLSSFGTEVVRIQALLDAVQGDALCFIAMDEPARGTNPREGAALVRALVSRLAALPSVSIVATHFDGVAQAAQAHYQAAGLRDLPQALPPQADRLAFLAAHMDYGLVRVSNAAQAPQEALAICRLLGLDPAVVADMERILAQ